MRSTFKVLFYTKNQAIKNGRVPVMGRITVNGTTQPASVASATYPCPYGMPKETVPGASPKRPDG